MTFNKGRVSGFNSPLNLFTRVPYHFGTLRSFVFRHSKGIRKHIRKAFRRNAHSHISTLG